MKTFKKIVFFLMITLATYASVERDCFSFSIQSVYVNDTAENGDESDNSITSNNDTSAVDVFFTPSNYSFCIKNLPGEKVTLINKFLLQKIDFCIWQPPKIS